MQRMLLSKAAFLIFFVVILSSLPLLAQKGGGKPGGAPASPASPGGISPNPHPEDEWVVYDVPRTTWGESRPQQGPPPCFRWPISGTLSAVVSTSQLQVPDKAYSEFQEGCSNVSGKKLQKAQQHLEKAVQIDPQYVVAWVLLGQVQKDQQKADDAANSCEKAMNLDSKYLPSYLCLADLSARANKWDKVAALTDQVIGFHPLKSPGAYYYNALANLNLHQLDAAEKSGLQATQDGPVEQKALAHWTLARIYEEKGDRGAEATQLREFLKLQPHADIAPQVNRILKQIDDEGSKSATPQEKK